MRSDFDFSGRHFRVHRFGGAAVDAPEHGDDVLRPQALRRFDERGLIPHHDLRDAVSIANVDEDERAEIAYAMNPAEQDHVPAGIRRRQSTARVSAGEISEGNDVGCRHFRLFSIRATSWRGSCVCSPVFMSLMVTTPRARSSGPSTATRGTPVADAYL